MARVKDGAPALSEAEKRWIKKTLAEQQQRDAQIIADMEQLTGQRDARIEMFFERLQTRGFNPNGDLRRKIDAADIPEKPDRPFKVVF